MTDNTNKVTIDAAWFIELFRNSQEKNQTLEATYNQVRKERDELKAKLDGVSLDQLKLLDEKLKAAERCIDDIDTFWHKWNIGVPFEDGENFFQRVYNTIRAYRAAKEAK